MVVRLQDSCRFRRGDRDNDSRTLLLLGELLPPWTPLPVFRFVRPLRRYYEIIGLPRSDHSGCAAKIVFRPFPTTRRLSGNLWDIAVLALEVSRLAQVLRLRRVILFQSRNQLRNTPSAPNGMLR